MSNDTRILLILCRKPLWACACIAVMVCACLDMDSFLFGGVELDEYSLDDYTGSRECGDYIDSAGPIDPDVVRVVSFPSGSETIYGVLLHADTLYAPSDTLILYCHGKSDHIDNYWPRVRLLFDAAGGRYPVLAIDYRGYGMSSGEPTENGLYEDGRSALRYVASSLGDPQVIVYAYSLGSIVGCLVASENPGGRVLGLALEAPIGEASTIVSDAAYLNIPGSAVTTYDANNKERIRDVDMPLLWLHGTEDGTLAIETNGQLVWENYDWAGFDSCGAALVVQGGLHYNLPKALSKDYATYKNTFRHFVQGSCRANPGLYTEFKPLP